MTEQTQTAPQQQQIQPSQDSIQKGSNAIQYSQKLINMSLQEIWNIAYTSGYSDAMAIIKTDQQGQSSGAGLQ
jgi:hypothetical protein